MALITLPMMSSVQRVVPDRSYQWVPRTPMLVLIMQVSNNREIMGDRVNGNTST